MARLESRVVAFQIETKGGDAGDGSAFEGFAAAYHNIDRVGDIIVPGAFTQDIAFTRAEGKVRDEHCNTTGKITEADEQAPRGLYIKGAISATTDGLNQRILVRDKVITRLSVGYETLKREWLNSPDEVKSYWQAAGYTPTDDDLVMLGRFGGARLIQRAKVYEVSTTWLPVNDRASITNVKSMGQHAGPRFDEEAAHALAAVESLLERAGKVAEIRAKDGRSLSVKSLAMLNRLSGRLSELTQAAATEPPAPATDDDDVALFAKYILMGERLRGAH